MINETTLRNIINTTQHDFDFNDNILWRVSVVMRKKENLHLDRNFKILKIKYVHSINQLISFVKDVEKEYTLKRDMKLLYNRTTDNNIPVDKIRIYLNGRPFRKDRVMPSMLSLMSEYTYSNKGIHRDIYDKSVVKHAVLSGEKLWMIDYDYKSNESLLEMIASLPDVIDMYETPNGYHLICNKFDIRNLNEIDGWNVDVKNNRNECKVTNNVGVELFSIKKIPTYLISYVR